MYALCWQPIKNLQIMVIFIIRHRPQTFVKESQFWIVISWEGINIYNFKNNNNDNNATVALFWVMSSCGCVWLSVSKQTSSYDFLNMQCCTYPGALTVMWWMRKVKTGCVKKNFPRGNWCPCPRATESQRTEYTAPQIFHQGQMMSL